jgi:IS1 family transposase
VWAALSVNAEHALRPEEGKGPAMSVLSREQRLRVLAALVEGNSERAIERMTDVARQTVKRFALLVGQGAQRLHDRLARDLSCSLIEIDEIWSYVGKKQARLTPKDPSDFGDVYTFTALDASSRMIIAYRVGKRDQENTDAFIADLRARLLVMPQITSDGWSCYPSAIGASFGPGVDYAQMHKVFRASGERDDDYRTAQPRNPIVTKHPVFGVPDMKRASTSYAERQNGSQRHITGRMRRMVYAFSKKLDHHRAALALGYAWYNLGRVVRTLRVTPAMQAGVTDHVWSLEEFMDAVLAEPAGEKPTKRPLTHRAPEVPARELPHGRGWLRVITGGKGAAAAPKPPDGPSPLQPITSHNVTTLPSSSSEGTRQLDLLTWRPSPPTSQAPAVPTREPSERPPLGQLDLFRLEPEPEQ